MKWANFAVSDMKTICVEMNVFWKGTSVETAECWILMTIRQSVVCEYQF